MKKLFFLLSALALLGFAEKREPITIFMVGDSTMANKPIEKNSLERGWGMMLPGFFSPDVKVDNHARNGRSSKSFIGEGLWKTVCDGIKPGDFVFIQFGHNDEKPDTARGTKPETTFKQTLARYVNDTRERGATPVLFTSIVRRKFNENGKLEDTHGRYIGAVRELADSLKVACIDINAATHNLVENLGDEPSKKLFMWVVPGTNFALPEGKQDDTHLTAAGGRAVARLAVDSIAAKIPALAPFVRHYDFVVAKDGSGDFFTVQEAINAVPDFSKERRVSIYIRKGVYKEKLILAESKINVSFIGENQAETVLTYDDFAQKKNIFGQDKSTSGSASFYVYGHNFYAENITFENSAGRVGQAVAVFVSGDKVAFKNCRFLGNQDTLYTYGRSSRQYYESCYIEGTTDFIFGSSTAVFHKCEIRSKTDSYITAASTPQGAKFGYVFIDCKLTADSGVTKVYLGRPWRGFAKTAFVNCDLG
ncbi:MAG: GDSL-type esterase/lipase family protein, partial [Prevotellaceae bacterium]|nr:GDSL-type esterase/lipase family protein [Prevotellaceae bacterium]